MNVISLDRKRLLVRVDRPHVVVLGAGASVAALPNGDKRGLKPPLMSNFISTLGLEPVLRQYGVKRHPDDFEKLCGLLHGRPRYAALLLELKRRVFDYFSAFELPDAPTLYDHLVLSLRRKDTIATFNWDPLLVQAYERNAWRTDELPSLAVLHGSVAVAYCPDHVDNRGRPGTSCPACGRKLVRTPLLFPVADKGYLSNSFIARQWRATAHALQDATLLTIFGYSAPRSDAEAVRLLRNAWHRNGARDVLRAEIIDVKTAAEAQATWRSFLFAEARSVCSSFYDSWLGRHPRRTCEAAFWMYHLNKTVEQDAFPTGFGFDGLHAWLDAFVDLERGGRAEALGS